MRSWISKNGKWVNKKQWETQCFHVLTTRLDLQKTLNRFPGFRAVRIFLNIVFADVWSMGIKLVDVPWGSVCQHDLRLVYIYKLMPGAPFIVCLLAFTTVEKIQLWWMTVETPCQTGIIKCTYNCHVVQHSFFLTTLYFPHKFASRKSFHKCIHLLFFSGCSSVWSRQTPEQNGWRHENYPKGPCLERRLRWP